MHFYHKHRVAPYAVGGADRGVCPLDHPSCDRQEPSLYLVGRFPFYVERVLCIGKR